MAQSTQKSIHAYQRFGLFLVFLLVICAGGWSAWAHISGAVIANATVVVESNSKKVQHLEGGIVAEILVKNGDYVKAGQLLLRLDQVETRANLGIIDSQLNELIARRTRFEAERDGLDVLKFPVKLTKSDDDPEIGKITSGQEKLFDARRTAINGKKEQLYERINQLADEIRGLEAQQRAKETQLKYIDDELKGLMVLFRQNLVSVTRVLALQREEAKLKGEWGEIVADIAQAKGRVGETRLAIIQIDQDLSTEVLGDLREAETKIAELLERQVSAEARLKRTKIYAPRSGYVHQLNVHTIGGVISASEPVMLIVPKSDTLVFEARVEPQKIDQVERGQDAILRFPAFDRATTPELNGKVTRVSADLTQLSPEQPGFYTVRIRLNDNELQRIADKDLKPGMPAEAFIETGNRTALSYLLKPLADQINRTFRER